jgi:methionyl-tRNA synthetase
MFMINYDEFKKVEIRAGKILSAEKIPDTDKLLRLLVDINETVQVPVVSQALTPAPLQTPVVNQAPAVDQLQTQAPAPSAVVPPVVTKLPPRQIVSGIAMYFPDPAVLVGKTCMFVTNLEPRVIRGVESNGMIFAVSTPQGGFSLLEPNGSIPPGTMAK